MAEETPVDTDYTEPEGTVTLVSPSGGEYRTHSAVEINDLLYGQGYKLKDDSGPAAAEQSDADGPAATDAPTTPSAEAGSASSTEAPTSTPPMTTAAKAAPKTSASKPPTSGTATPPSTT